MFSLLFLSASGMDACQCLPMITRLEAYHGQITELLTEDFGRRVEGGGRGEGDREVIRRGTSAPRTS